MFTRTTMGGLAAAALLFSVAASAQTLSNTRTNPPGTAAERAVDRAAGTNTSGAYPRQSDGTRTNPPGTAAERAFDRAAGTNTSGAYPAQSDGTRANPPGTAVGRTLNRTTGTTR